MFFPHVFYSYPLAFLLAVCQYIDMVCIYCGSSTKVTNSRQTKRANAVWRRRSCSNCKSVFTTTETIDLSSALRIQESETVLTPFSRARLVGSVYDACKHLKKPAETADELVSTVITSLLQSKTAIISLDELINLTSTVLSRFDHAAAVQYKAFRKTN